MVNDKSESAIVIKDYVKDLKKNSEKMTKGFSKNFTYNIKGTLGDHQGNSDEYRKFINTRPKIYKEGKTNIKMQSPNKALVTFKTNSGLNIKQDIDIDNENKIVKITEEDKVLNKVMKGGQGYTYNVSINPVGGQPVVSPYYQCCRPIFFGDLLKGGGNKKQKGGKVLTGYRFDLGENHLNVLPQYRAYSHPV